MKNLNPDRLEAAPKLIEGRLNHSLPKSRLEADSLVHWADCSFGLESLEVLTLSVAAGGQKEILDAASRLLQGFVIDYQPERPRVCRVVLIPCTEGDVHVLLVQDRQETVHFSITGQENLLTEVKALGLEVI